MDVVTVPDISSGDCMPRRVEQTLRQRCRLAAKHDAASLLAVWGTSACAVLEHHGCSHRSGTLQDLTMPLRVTVTCSATCSAVAVQSNA